MRYECDFQMITKICICVRHAQYHIARPNQTNLKSEYSSITLSTHSLTQKVSEIEFISGEQIIVKC